MEILWALMAVVMIGAVLGPVILRRRRGIRQVQPGTPEAADPAQYGFRPQETLDIRLPGPDQDLLDVLDVVQRTQDWRAASQLLAGTDKHGELRWQRVQAFAGAASLELQQRPGEGGRWLRDWRAQEPKDAGGAAVHAEFLVQQAWRSSTAGSDDFRIILEEARSAVAQAALLAPGDPVPYISELAVARGLGYTQQEFDQLWLKILDRAPAHMGAHLVALPYWSEKWHGSRQQSMAFAEAAAARAPGGSLLSALPLFSLYEHLPEVNLVRNFFQSQVFTRALEGAQFAAQSARQDDPVLPHVRHLLVFFLVSSERWGEAMHQLVRVDGYVGALPWTLSADPAAQFAVYRALAVGGYEANGGSPATLRG
ncbi:hypothetical protein ACFU9O_21840 [Streptomyces albidoflavus]|uniref:hypothetical protein n=1 Tax=Streptomyces TaxID=1883 RepID=UPI0002F83FB2|nr:MULTISPECIES: hypothetical protein [Streptomyces]MCU7706070.1 hypothetical protein [Streptomyces albidoflavus]QHC15772.1 hypothetical protein GR131_10145 [Streptomyces sp. GF20]RZD74738.1 hypothetical protein C0Q61_21150 [Streptomyces albidoflavus]RZD77098.1 hypothetical protein C0Q60_21475 [Streptomyces albidoflavus]RZD81945.1 hypothetical protein C0Q63_20995 [Streptomyces albidoflavus]